MDILTLLSSGQPVSGQSIAKGLGISRAAVHKKILKLRNLGYTITGHRNLGYSLVSRTNVLLPQEIEPFLNKASIGSKIYHYTETSSTQVIAKEKASQGEGEGSVIVADAQSSGYGRIGRSWHAPQGGIWFSAILRPLIEPDAVPHITFIMSLAICRVLKGLLGLSPAIKWPNDVLLEGKKVSGILTEMSAEVGRINWVVTGVGINANNELPSPLKGHAITLSQAMGKEVNRAEVLGKLLSEFSGMYDTFSKSGFAPFQNEYNSYSIIIGREVKVNCPDGTYGGKVDHIGGNGYLYLRLEGGEVKKVIAGDVSF